MGKDLDKNVATFKPKELRELILRCLGIDLLVGGTIVFPNLPIVVATIISLVEKEKGLKAPMAKVKRTLQTLEKNKREYLRRFLVELGFYPYQKSVYIFPYECEKEVALVKQIVKGTKYIKYIIAEKIEDEENIKTFFHLS